jgi:hypothetical protein
MLKLRSLLVPVLITGFLAIATPQIGSAQSRGGDDTFTWSDRIPADGRLVIRNNNGDVKVETTKGTEVTVRAVKSPGSGDPLALSVSVTRLGPGAKTVLICGLWKPETLACGEDSYSVNNMGPLHSRIDFVVSVPSNLEVHAESINGTVRITGLTGDVTGASVNGEVIIAVGDNPNADIRVSSLNGKFTSEFPLNNQRVAGRGTSRVRLGNGGRTIRFRTVNGAMRLVRL